MARTDTQESILQLFCALEDSSYTLKSVNLILKDTMSFATAPCTLELFFLTSKTKSYV